MAFIPDEAVDRMTELSAGAWRLYCFLARCRNQKTGKCCPSPQTSAEAVGAHLKHISRLRRELVGAGWVEFKGNEATLLIGFAGNKNATTVVVDIELAQTGSKNVTDRATGNNIVTAPIEDGTKMLPDGAKMLPGGNNFVPTYKEEPAKEPANRTSKERHDMSGAVAPTVSSLVLEVFTYWQTAMKHSQAKLTPKRNRNIYNRLKEGYTVAQIQTAIDGCRASPFHMGQNDRGTVYDDIELICRSGEKLESFIGRSASGRQVELSPQGQASVAAGQAWVRQKQEEFERTGKV